MALFVWDENKREANLAAHGLDFADAAERFGWDDATTSIAHPGKQGEPRFKAVGMLDGRVVAVIFALLGSEAISIISVRPASLKERRTYAEKKEL